MNTTPAIITVTFSPCIDKSTSVPSLVPEKKLRCSFPKMEPGGGGINVARAIKKLGGEALAVYPSGGYTGKFLTQLLAQEKIPGLVIETEEETRENVIVVDESTQQQYRFGMPGAFLYGDEWDQLVEGIENIHDPEFIVVSGSLPPGAPANIVSLLAAIAKRKNAKFIGDVSGPALQEVINEEIYLIKPNLGELAHLVGKDYLHSYEVPGVAQQLIERTNCEVVVVSMGAAGAMLVTKTIVQAIAAPKVKRKSTVGAGDSMVGGIVLSLSKGKSLEESVKYGVACGTAATMNDGTELCNKKDADNLYAQMNAYAGN